MELSWKMSSVFEKHLEEDEKEKVEKPLHLNVEETARLVLVIYGEQHFLFSCMSLL